MSEQPSALPGSTSAQLPRVSSALLIVLYFIVAPYTLLGPPLAMLGTGRDMEMSLARERPAESITAEALALQPRPPGSHLTISGYSMVVGAATGRGVQVMGIEVKPEPPIENGASIYARLSEATALNVVNSGDVVMPRLKPLITKDINLPPLDAVVVESDSRVVRVVDTTALMPVSQIWTNRILAGLVFLVGLASVYAIIRIHRHRALTKRSAVLPPTPAA